MFHLSQQTIKDDPEKYGVNFGKPWNTLEENKMLDLIKLGKNIDEIATSHGRTAGSIRARLRQVSRNLRDEGKTLEEIKQVIVLLPEWDIQKALAYEPKIPKKDKKQTLNLVVESDRDNDIVEILYRIDDSLSNLLGIIVKKDKPVQETKDIWTEQLLKRIEKNIDNKVKLKEIRKEHGISVEDFYKKVNELKA